MQCVPIGQRFSQWAPKYHLLSRGVLVGQARALLERRGEGGRGSRGGGEPPPPAGLNHIDQELQKCTTLTHSVYTFVIMSEHR